MVRKTIILLLFSLIGFSQTSVEHYSNVMVVEEGIMTLNSKVNVTIEIKKNQTVTLYFFNHITEYYYQIGSIGNKLKCLDSEGNAIVIELFDFKLIIRENENKWTEYQK